MYRRSPPGWRDGSLGIRESGGVTSRFVLYHVVWDGRWTTHIPRNPTTSAPVLVRGSGRARVEEAVSVWRRANAGGTSRAVFSAFCNALRENPHPETGGAPQLVGIISKAGTPGFAAGVIFGGRPYFQGLAAAEFTGRAAVPWFNELFERCDHQTLARSRQASTHVRPGN